jgi:glycerol kinase
MQLQADALGTRCIRPTQLETTALGSAFLAGLAIGIWDSPQAVSEAWRQDRVFSPEIKDEIRMSRLHAWHAVVERA